MLRPGRIVDFDVDLDFDVDIDRDLDLNVIPIVDRVRVYARPGHARCGASQLLICGSDIAPLWRATSRPARNTIKVGIERMS